MTRHSPATPERDAAGARPAVTAAVACYVLWGLMPLMFILMARLGAGDWEIVAHRAFWSVFWAAPLVLAARQGRQVAAILRSPRTLAWLTASGLVIAVNWTLFIVAVNDGRSLETSLGYYLNPLLNMAVGAALFRERLSRISMAAIALAAVGVAVQAVAMGHMPWFSLGLAATFCVYGVIRKRVAADAQAGLFIECLVLALPGLAYGLWLHAHGQAHFGQSAGLSLLLLLNGPATVVPLVLFAWAARRLPLSTVGFIQFIGPTLQFFIGLSLGEAMTPLRGLSFAFIWGGVGVFVWGAARAAGRSRPHTGVPAPGLRRPRA